jgi:YgiT-type zinc finger domain-containing protein
MFDMTDTTTCPACDATATRVEERDQTFTVKGEAITVFAPVRLCAECGKTLFDAEFDDAMMGMIYERSRAPVAAKKRSDREFD